MSDKRLFLSTIVVVEHRDWSWRNHIETYVDWLTSEDEARGTFVKHAMTKYPNGKLDSMFVRDITEYAKDPCP